MGDKELYHFFEGIGPVEYAIVLSKKYDNKVSRYGFVTFVSLETARSALAASRARLTLDVPWRGWSLTVGPAVERKKGHQYHYPQQEGVREGPRVWGRSSDPVQGENKPAQQAIKAAASASKLRVDAETWQGRPGQQPGELEAQLYHQHLQALNLHFQQQQQLQYQAELQYNMMAQSGYFPLQHYPDLTNTSTTTSTDQLMILPPTFYHPTGGVVWPQYPQLYPAYQQCEQQQQQQQVLPQEYSQPYPQQCEQMQDSGYHELTNASIVTGDLSHSANYETKEVSASPVLNLSQVLHQDTRADEDPKRVGPYKRFKTFNGENLLRTSKAERGGRASKPTKDSIITREPSTTTAISTKGKEKEVKKGIKKKVVHTLPEAEVLPEPFKQLSIK